MLILLVKDRRFATLECLQVECGGAIWGPTARGRHLNDSLLDLAGSIDIPHLDLFALT
jgi:hypothetical protein